MFSRAHDRAIFLILDTVHAYELAAKTIFGSDPLPVVGTAIMPDAVFLRV
jgi:hypothetical protein